MSGFPREAYLAKINLTSAPPVTAEGLISLHRAQAMAIPFENIDPFLHQTVSLDALALEEKLLRRNRGGYCFELNGLFLAALNDFGFNARPLLARVLLGNASPGPCTHQLSLVFVEGEYWIADVGFGGPGLRDPLRLRAGALRDGPREIRLREDAELGWVLEQRIGEEWGGIYAFSLDEAREMDREMGNFFSSQWPQSLFRRKLMAARFTPEGRVTLDDKFAKKYRADGAAEERTLSDPALLRFTLADWFKLEISPATAREIFERLNPPPLDRAKPLDF
ncbi:MAG: arylamine N-acetyltransferase [Proteobacteria bacterium]|nr:MAG: arylamine N-acetyltransferase [Pseudomonadota bacterium]